MGSMYAIDFIYGFTLGICGVVIGFAPLKSKEPPFKTYILFCTAGVIACFSQSVNYYFDESRSFTSIVEQLAILASFMLLAFMKKSKRYNNAN